MKEGPSQEVTATAHGDRPSSMPDPGLSSLNV